mgnify:CR=1 FL=1
MSKSWHSQNLLGGINYPSTTGSSTVVYGGGGAGGFGGGGGAGAIYGPTGQNYKLVAEKLEEWDWFMNFLEQNPDIKEKYQAHKTYEILKDDHGQR